MAITTHDEMLFLVRQRYPNLEAGQQARVATMALAVMEEPHWAKLNITPLTAVKLASHRFKRPSVTGV
jgi:hypothetical protein